MFYLVLIFGSVSSLEDELAVFGCGGQLVKDKQVIL